MHVRRCHFNACRKPTLEKDVVKKDGKHFCSEACHLHWQRERRIVAYAQSTAIAYETAHAWHPRRD